MMWDGILVDRISSVYVENRKKLPNEIQENLIRLLLKKSPLRVHENTLAAT